MKTFKEYLVGEGIFTDIEIDMLNENLKTELTPEEEKKVDEAVNKFVTEYLKKTKGAKEFNEDLTNEGFLGTVLGGLTGYALGSSMGKIIANVLGVEKGILYDMLTSRLVGAALGAAIGKRMI